MILMNKLSILLRNTFVGESQSLPSSSRVKHCNTSLICTSGHMTLWFTHLLPVITKYVHAVIVDHGWLGKSLHSHLCTFHWDSVVMIVRSIECDFLHICVQFNMCIMKCKTNIGYTTRNAQQTHNPAGMCLKYANIILCQPMSCLGIIKTSTATV